MSDRAPVLATEGISKSFGGTRALDGVSLDVAAGEIHALCGENGAGKSTLIKILAGLYPHGSYEGRLLRDGREVGFRGVRDAERAGVAVVTQELALVPEMTVAENVFLGHETLAGRFLDGPRMAHETAGWLGRFGLANAFAAPDTPVRALGIGQQQLVEIIRALRKQPKVLILDEPTAALGEAEARRLFAQVRAGARDGMACVYISHRLDEVLDLADRVTVLRDGRAVLTAAARGLDVARLIRAMAGREIRDIYPRTRASAAATPGPVLLEVDGLSAAAARGRAAALHDIRLRVRAGEVLGLAGLLGAGRSRLLLHLYGAWGTRLGGEVRLGGRPYSAPCPAESLRRGLALVTEDRRRYGLIPGQSVAFNLSLSVLTRLTRAGLIDPHAEARANQAMARTVRLRAPGPEAPVGTLSGGNQQKLLLGRALLADPRVVLLDEPTRGIDVAARHEVYEEINELTRGGKAVVMASSDLPELLGMSDRLLVLRQGRVAGAFPREEFAPERILAVALGHDPGTPT